MTEVWFDVLFQYSQKPDYDALLLHVDQALCDAKQGGRNQFKVYS